jgi:hypothetical protein
MDDYDYCDDCRTNGDDYYFDDNGDMVCACTECDFFYTDWEDD